MALQDWFYSQFDNIRDKFQTFITPVYVVGGSVGQAASSGGAATPVNLGTVATLNSAAATQIIAGDANRKYLLVANNSDVAFGISFGTAVGLATTTWVVYLPPYNTYEIPQAFVTSAVYGIAMDGNNKQAAFQYGV